MITKKKDVDTKSEQQVGINAKETQQVGLSPTYPALFVQSHYSLLSSTIKIKQLVKDLKDFGITSIAITDNHNLFGAMEFSIECAKNKIHGIIGCRARLEGNREILLYCKNRIGYENLSHLLTDSYITAKDDNPSIKWQALLKKSEGLIAIIVPSMIAANFMDLENCANMLGDGIEWYFGLEPDPTYHAQLAKASMQFKKSIVAISQACYMYPGEEIAHDAMICIRDKRYISETDRLKSSPVLKLKTAHEMYEAYKGLEFAIKNCERIAGKCNFILEPSKPQIPRFKFNNITQEAALTEAVKVGLRKKLLEHNITTVQEYEERLKYELSVILEMGFAGYFMIVSDVIKFARDNGIPASARGSASGSLVAWVTEITSIDPIKFELYFERFLNPGRVAIPDIDIDFSPNGRDVVIDYVRQKYGNTNIAGIITFGSLSSRVILKDIGRIFQVPYSKTDSLSKKVQILFGRVDSLQETYEKDPAFAGEIDGDEDLKRIFQIGKIIEGSYRHVSAHAAGIVIRNQPIFKICPLYKDKHSGVLLTQFSMKYAEVAGLVKFDFLGLTALEVIQNVVGLLAEKGISLNIDCIALDDPKTFELMLTGNTKGIFQFETAGMTNLIKNMRAKCIEDLIAIISLYRPGPMDNIPLFIRSKEGKEKITYKYPKIDNILSNTYGIMIYQEQITKIAQEVAGFSMVDADLLRRAMGKKNPQEMASYKKRFIEGTVSINGGTEGDAEEIFNQIERFANYGFNKAHAAAYAIIGYRQAYLKAHYTLEFMSVSLTLEQQNVDKITELINDTKKIGIKILPPSINHPSTKFEIVGDCIRYSLSAIKNIGISLAEAIMKEREKGEFTSYSNLLERVSMNKRQAEYLSMSGALDEFGQKAKFSYPQKTGFSLFDAVDIEQEEEPQSREEYLNKQKEALSAYISSHPTEEYHLAKLKMTPISSIANEGVACVLIHKIAKKLDRNKKPYGICSVSDVSGFCKVIIPNEDLLCDAQAAAGQILVVNIKVRHDRLIIDGLRPISEHLKTLKSIHIKIANEGELRRLKEILSLITTEDEIIGVEIFIHTSEVIPVRFVTGEKIPELIITLEKEKFTWAVRT